MCLSSSWGLLTDVYCKTRWRKKRFLFLFSKNLSMTKGRASNWGGPKKLGKISLIGYIYHSVCVGRVCNIVTQRDYLKHSYRLCPNVLFVCSWYDLRGWMDVNVSVFWYIQHKPSLLMMMMMTMTAAKAKHWHALTFSTYM